MTDGAVERVKELLKDKDPAPHGIRLGVRTRGCNGLSYTLNYVYEPQKLDDIVEAGGVKVYIDPKAVMYLVGARMDFVEDAVKVGPSHAPWPARTYSPYTRLCALLSPREATRRRFSPSKHFGLSKEFVADASLVPKPCVAHILSRGKCHGVAPIA